MVEVIKAEVLVLVLVLVVWGAGGEEWEAVRWGVNENKVVQIWWEIVRIVFRERDVEKEEKEEKLVGEMGEMGDLLVVVLVVVVVVITDGEVESGRG